MALIQCYTRPVKTEKVFQNVSESSTQRITEQLMCTLAEAGHSCTVPRRVIVEVLAGARGLLSPAEILTLGQRQHPRLGLVTVYRTLDLLTTLGLVRKIHMAGGCHSYTVMHSEHGHHIVCQQCRQVIEFHECELDHLFQSVAQHTGYRVTAHWLELLGICPQCQRARENRENEVGDADTIAS